MRSFDTSVLLRPPLIVSLPWNTTHHVFSQLHPGTTYQFVIRGSTVKGFGPPATLNVTTNISGTGSPVQVQANRMHIYLYIHRYTLTHTHTHTHTHTQCPRRQGPEPDFSGGYRVKFVYLCDYLSREIPPG